MPGKEREKKKGETTETWGICLRAAETSLECGHAGEKGEIRVSRFHGRKL